MHPHSPFRFRNVSHNYFQARWRLPTWSCFFLKTCRMHWLAPRRCNNCIRHAVGSVFMQEEVYFCHSRALLSPIVRIRETETSVKKARVPDWSRYWDAWCSDFAEILRWRKYRAYAIDTCSWPSRHRMDIPVADKRATFCMAIILENDANIFYIDSGGMRHQRWHTIVWCNDKQHALVWW